MLYPLERVGAHRGSASEYAHRQPRGFLAQRASTIGRPGAAILTSLIVRVCLCLRSLAASIFSYKFKLRTTNRNFVCCLTPVSGALPCHSLIIPGWGGAPLALSYRNSLGQLSHSLCCCTAAPTRLLDYNC